MLNADDQFTPASLYRLREAVRQKRPLVIWVGPGASQWAGLPSLHDSARRMRRDFAKGMSVKHVANEVGEQFPALNNVLPDGVIIQLPAVHSFGANLVKLFGLAVPLVPLLASRLKQRSH